MVGWDWVGCCGAQIVDYSAKLWKIRVDKLFRGDLRTASYLVEWFLRKYVFVLLVETNIFGCLHVSLFIVTDRLVATKSKLMESVKSFTNSFPSELPFGIFIV